MSAASSPASAPSSSACNEPACTCPGTSSATPSAKRVLREHWPDVPCYDDVCEVGAHNLPPVSVLAGGFPCQDISDGGPRLGLDGARSGLWREYARVIREIRPSYVLVENVAALVARGLDRVLADLAALGFDAEWTTLRASDFGAPHPRDRLWLVAYPAGSDGASRNLLGAGEDRRAPVAARGLPGLAMAPRWEPRGVWGTTEPPTPLLVDGAPGLMDEVAAIGNALVPQIAEELGRRIIVFEEHRHAL